MDFEAVLNAPRANFEKLWHDPECIVLEAGFLLSNLFHILACRDFMQKIDCPVTLTWFQMLFSLINGYVLGEASVEFTKIGYFSRMHIDTKLVSDIAVASLFYTGAMVSSNILLSKAPFLATYPLLVASGVIMLYLLRHFGYNQQYQTWKLSSMGLMAAAYVFCFLDGYMLRETMFKLSLFHGVVTAVYRGIVLEKLLHIFDGSTNALQNHQQLVALGFISVGILFSGESFFSEMPYDPLSQNTWMMWGCVVACSSAPFVKNVMANQLIRYSGQTPYRVLEILGFILLLIISVLGHFSTISVVGFLALGALLVGRVFGVVDIYLEEAALVSGYEVISGETVQGEAAQGAAPASGGSVSGGSAPRVAGSVTAGSAVGSLNSIASGAGPAANSASSVGAGSDAGGTASFLTGEVVSGDSLLGEHSS